MSKDIHSEEQPNPPKETIISVDREYTELDKEKLIDDDHWKEFWKRKAEWEEAKKYVTPSKNSTSTPNKPSTTGNNN